MILITLKDNIPQENLTEFSLSLSTTTVFSNCLLSESNKFQESGNPFSSVLTFSAVPLTEAPTATDSKYSFTISPASPSSTNSFVKKLPTSSTEFPESDYQTRFSVLENTASSPVVTSSTKYIALFPQYSKDIMEFLFTLNLNNSVLTKETVMNSGISFTCDWNLII